MVVVAVAKHESVELIRVDAQQIDIVVERFWREPEIHQEVSCLAAAPRLGVHRQSELADQRPARWLVAGEAPAKVLDIDRPNLLARRDGELVAVDDDTN